MLFLDQNDPVKKHLEELRSHISVIAVNCIQSIFDKTCTINNDWQIIERLNGNYTHNVCLGCGNDTFQALAVIATGDKEINEFIESTDPDDILDAFGEVLNTYFAMLMDHAMFSDKFGILTQSFAQYSADVNFYSKAWGCSGTLLTPHGGSLYIGFAIKNNPPVSA